MAKIDIQKVITETLNHPAFAKTDLNGIKEELQFFHKSIDLSDKQYLDNIPETYKEIYRKRKNKGLENKELQLRSDIRNLFIINLFNKNITYELKTILAKYISSMKFYSEDLDSSLNLSELKNNLPLNPDKPTRGVETMFRVTSKNHLDLSALADNKANILISVNVILISIMVSGLGTKVDTNQQFLLPVIIILLVALVTIIFATISTIPNVTNFQMTRKDIDSKKGNLLFFGNFSKLNLDDYEYGINVLMNDKEYLYNSMAKDIYFLGKVLDRKYKYLRIAYRIFMIGLVIATISFIISMIGSE